MNSKKHYNNRLVVAVGDCPVKTGLPRSRSIVLSERISEDNPVRVIDALVDSLDLAVLGFRQMGTYAYGAPACTSNAKSGCSQNRCAGLGRAA